MARLPKKLFEHYMYSPYALPVCRDFLENMGCGSDCLLAHPPRRVRIFHPRFFSEEFPAGIVICCKNFVHYGDCSCRHMLPSAKSAMVLDLFFHPPTHVCEYIKEQVEANPKERAAEEEREEASGESETFSEEAAPVDMDADKTLPPDSSPSPDLSPRPQRAASEPAIPYGPRSKPNTPLPIRPPGVLPSNMPMSPALMRGLEERAALVSLANPLANLLGLTQSPLCMGLGAGPFPAGGVQ